MHPTPSNLNPIHWTIKKIYAFHDNSQVKPPPPKNTSLNSSSKNSDLNQLCLSLKLKRYLVNDYF